MNVTAGFLDNLLTPPTSNDWKDPKWICHIINQSQTEGQDYINLIVSTLSTHSEKMQFLYGVRSCIEYTIRDLENYLNDNAYPISCCPSDAVWDAENSIRIFQSALLKINSAICYEMVCEKIPCASQPKGNGPNLTPHQWALALHVFFKVLGIETTNGGQINQVLLARFAHLISGEECPAIINNSKFLDYLKTAPHFDRTIGRKTVQDLETVRVHFERVGISEALKIIDTLILQFNKIK